MRLVRIVTFVSLSCALALGVCSADPITFSKVFDPAMFGHLDQHDLNGCPGLPDKACGPAAAVNSFVFLENMYPGLRGELVGVGEKGQTLHDSEVSVGNDLARNYMNTCCGKATAHYSFENGKASYLTSHATNATWVFEAQDSPKLFSDPAFPAPPYSKQVTPTWEFMLKNLMDGEDVEILLSSFNEKGEETYGHFVTVTGFTFVDETGDGIPHLGEATLNFVDPFNGSSKTREIFQSGAGQPLMIFTMDGGTREVTQIVAESPTNITPEPGSFLLLLTGLLAFPIHVCWKILVTTKFT